MLDCIKREVRPCGRKDVQFLFFEKQFCCAAVTRSLIKVKALRRMIFMVLSFHQRKAVFIKPALFWGCFWLKLRRNGFASHNEPSAKFPKLPKVGKIVDFGIASF